jgi:hypothetical protein
MADIDREKFAYAVAAALHRRDLSLNAAHKQLGLRKGMMSRVANGLPQSAPNYLLICKKLALDPFEFLVEAAPNPHSTFGLPHREKLEKTGGSSSCHP